ncbi:MAG: DJ-1/PfpI family protein, partial [Verrucomicrobiota bacterium]
MKKSEDPTNPQKEDLNRRGFIGASAVASTAAFLGTAEASELDGNTLQKSALRLPPPHGERMPVVAMLLHPGVTLLDLLGPQTVLAPSCHVHLVWKNTDLLETDSGIVMKASSTFDECPKDLDVLFVPGGDPSVMLDSEVLQFLADRGARARYITSVCGGSIVLGAAGLLQGYKATSHWSVRETLSLFGATPINA